MEPLKIKSKPRSKHLSKQKDQLVAFKDRAKYIYLCKPHKFLNPHTIYQVFSGLLFFEENSQFHTSSQALNLTHRIGSVEVDSPFPGIIKVNLISSSNITPIPLSYLVARMKSFGDADMYEWADLLENTHEKYSKSFDRVFPAFSEGKYVPGLSECIIPEDFDLESFLSGRLWWMNSSYLRNDIKAESVCYSTKYIELMGYDLQQFIKMLFDEGLPSCYYDLTSHFKIFMRYGIKRLFEFQFTKSAERKIDLLHASGVKLHVTETLGVWLRKGHGEEIKSLQYFKASYKRVQLPIAGDSEFWTYKKSQRDVKEDLKQFLQLYYSIEKREILEEKKEILKEELEIVDESKVCLVKEINQNKT